MPYVQLLQHPEILGEPIAESGVEQHRILPAICEERGVASALLQRTESRAVGLADEQPAVQARKSLAQEGGIEAPPVVQPHHEGCLAEIRPFINDQRIQSGKDMA